MDAKITGNKLVLTITLDKDGRPSQSGKTTIYFTTGGFTAIPGTDKRVAINVTGPAK